MLAVNKDRLISSHKYLGMGLLAIRSRGYGWLGNLIIHIVIQLDDLKSLSSRAPTPESALSRQQPSKVELSGVAATLGP